MTKEIEPFEEPSREIQESLDSVFEDGPKWLWDAIDPEGRLSHEEKVEHLPTILPLDSASRACLERVVLDEAAVVRQWLADNGEEIDETRLIPDVLALVVVREHFPIAGQSWFPGQNSPEGKAGARALLRTLIQDQFQRARHKWLGESSSQGSVDLEQVIPGQAPPGRDRTDGVD